jgi:hypothetical protein
MDHNDNAKTPLRWTPDYGYSREWREALAAIRRTEEAPMPLVCRCTAPMHVVEESMRLTRRVRECRDALRRARKER